MPAIIYSYRGFTATGEQTAGSTKADSLDMAREDLKRRGVVATLLEPQNGAYALLRGEIALPWGRRQAQIQFFRTFAMLARAGKNTDDALAITVARTTNKLFRESLMAVRAEMNAGASLSEAFATRPASFSGLQVAMIKVGEKAGAIDDILDRLASFLEEERANSRRITGALAYPAVVLTSAITLVTFMFTTIIPQFATFFKSYDVELPAVTKVMLAISAVLTQPVTPLVVLLGLVAAGFLLYRALQTTPGRVALDRIRLRIPLFGNLVRKSIVSRISRLLSLLLQSGVDIDQSLEIMLPVAGSPVFARALDAMRADLASGSSFVQAIETTNLFDGLFIALLDSGAETGAVDQTLITIANYYDDDIAATVVTLNAALQPVLLLFLGIVTTLIAIGVYLPLYQLVSNVR
jgi:type IV pilus assembly protein PilC